MQYFNINFSLYTVDYDGARTAAAVLFTFMAVMLVLAIAAAVVAGVLFWRGRREQNSGGFEKSSLVA